ncbi:zinc finger protein GIS-like [Ananas comosus]|uniref:Zinc finger protein GIS-like n=1 Tax=Ananas comosus TaxID=4615 RepID=A0A6P5H5J0_ANACO|nr:zinc finger protein GIS-like [Ananas comosus]
MADLADKKESKGSTEDDRDSPNGDGSDDDDDDDDDTASAKGQFYNCTFCKRGFSTAQALGGHMNIHRKERARTTTTTTTMSRSNSTAAAAAYVVSESVEGSGSSTGGYYYSPSSQSVRAYSAHSQRPRELCLFGSGDLSLGLGLHGGDDELS